MAVQKKGSDLARMRIERGMTQEAAARLIGVDHSQISRYESGTSDPSLSVFRSMRETYGVTADALLRAIDRSKRAGARRRKAA